MRQRGAYHIKNGKDKITLVCVELRMLLCCNSALQLGRICIGVHVFPGSGCWLLVAEAIALVLLHVALLSSSKHDALGFQMY